LFFAVAAGPAAAGQTGIGGSGGGGLTGTSTTTTPTTTTPSTTTTTTKSTSEKLPSSEGSHLFGSRMLTLGMKGTDVTVLQRDLSALDLRIPATGHFNRLTLQRLKAFQRKYRLVVDGVAGPTTISTLKRLLNSKLHITESALAAREIANGIAVTATSDNQPLPAGDSGLSGGVGLGTSTTGTTGSTTEQNATIVGGLVIPAPGTPPALVKMLDAANRIAFDPYIYGGGHASFNAAGYDCSGSVSYVLHAGGLLASPLDSEQFLQYGLAGKGNWITVYTNGPTHAYMEIAGLWFDTAAQTALNGDDRWSPTRIGEPGYGKFIARHPSGW
jgi:peptidoglycan hydrolase-like protein with peptidoglycan-binding domain